MSARTRVAVVAMLLLAGCGDDRAEPVAKIAVEDRTSETARQRTLEPRLLRPLAQPTEHDRLIYDPPVNLARQTADTTVTAPFGVATPDTMQAGRRIGGAARDTARGAARDTTRNPR